MDETTKKIAESFECGYTLFENGSRPELVDQAYKAALARGKADGFYPAIICLDEYAVDWLEEVAGDEYDRDEIIRGCKDNGKDILKERLEDEALWEALKPKRARSEARLNCLTVT